MHADGANRAALVLLGLLLFLGGLGGVLLGYGAFGSGRAELGLLDNPITRFVGDYGAWFWPLLALIGVLAALFGLRWIARIALSTDRVGELTVPEDTSGGRTSLASRAVTRAVVEEVSGYRGVHSAGARIIGIPDAPQLVLDVVAEEAADLAALRRRVQDEAIAHCRQALGQSELPVTVNLGITTKQASRVG